MKHTHFFTSKITLKFFVLAVFLFGNVLLSYSQEESWESYILNKEKGPMAVTLNMEYYITRPNYKNLLVVGTNTNKCLKNGYPKEAGLEKLYTFSDSIANIVSKITKSRLAGIITYQCAGFDVFYVKDTIGLRNKLSTFINTNYSTSKNYLEIRADKRWSYFNNSLLPKDLSNDFFVNHELLTDLVYNGDDLTEPRKIEHFIYFRKEKRRQKFIDKIQVLNYKVDSLNVKKNEYLPFELKISRTDSIKPQSIAELTKILKRLSSNFYGTYDGWSTEPIIKD